MARSEGTANESGRQGEKAAELGGYLLHDLKIPCHDMQALLPRLAILLATSQHVRPHLASRHLSGVVVKSKLRWNVLRPDHVHLRAILTLALILVRQLARDLGRLYPSSSQVALLSDDDTS
ncbi:hypothetical protein M378DRAFT_859506 [Amanita muscaria Koide BX008]|uniref:Uncharacterized protein n=1 Tax=Amanita muscaria (strain Koide BX008) TaxID=946122 RepID=A0A0C2SDX3_AMAMK|nr:hypothetical protein M378DRAFT_859506 [Amanita muscaria Koide BX008]